MSDHSGSLSTGPAPCHECARRRHCLGGLLCDDGVTDAQPNPGVHRSVLPKGQHLHRYGDRAETVAVIRSGALKTYVVSPEGEEQIRAFQLANDIAGLEAICSDTYRGSAKALSRTWVCRLPIAAVRARMLESPVFRDRLLATFGRELDRLHGMLHRERCNADQRVAAFLLAQFDAGDGSGALLLPMTRADLARHLDLATETVSRVFTRLQARKALRADGAYCEILDRDLLVAALDDAGGAPSPGTSKT